MTGMLALSWSLMVSQAMESVTRAFYSRSDLDLILSSPAAAQRLFAVRIATMTLAIALVSLLLASPFINVLAALGGLRWLAAYGGRRWRSASRPWRSRVALTIALFMTLGPKRTRLVAQVMAAVIGAAFVIGLQLAAIQSSAACPAPRYCCRPHWSRIAPDAAACFTGRRAPPPATSRRSRASSPSACFCSARRSRCLRRVSAIAPWPPAACPARPTRRLTTSNGFRRSSHARACG